MFNKIPRKSYILMLLVFALSMMVFPFDVAMEFSAGPEETTLQVFPYFSLTPWGYGNWFPLLAGILTLAVVVMVFLPPRWKLDKAMAIVLGLSMVCTPLSWLLFNTFADGCDFAWDVAIEPGMEQKATHFFSNACVVNAESENKEAAMTWITWLCSSPAAAEIRIEAGWDLPAINDEEVLASYLDLTPPENREVVFESLDYLVVPPVIEDYALMSDIIGQKLSAAANGSITVQEALDQAQSECEAQISLS